MSSVMEGYFECELNPQLHYTILPYTVMHASVKTYKKGDFILHFMWDARGDQLPKAFKKYKKLKDKLNGF